MKAARAYLTCLALLFASPLAAAEPEIVSDEELATLRGGFRWNGLDIQLGAEIRSFLDGRLVMQTNVQLTEAGMATTRFVSGDLSPVAAQGLQQSLIGESSIDVGAGGANAYYANDQRTAFIHRVDGAFQNIVLNTASGADVRQEMDIVLDLANFAEFQTNLSGDRLAAGLQQIADASLLSATRP